MKNINITDMSYDDDPSIIKNQLDEESLAHLIYILENINGQYALCNRYPSNCKIKANCEDCIFSFRANKNNSPQQFLDWLNSSVTLGYEYNF